MIGVAISTTGQSHRMGFLETCVQEWVALLEESEYIAVTVDGSPEDAQRVVRAVGYLVDVFRIGQPRETRGRADESRLGVAANKNSGMELLMDSCGPRGFPDIEHLFLCDDDTYPLNRRAIDLHVESPLKHSMACWGRHRLDSVSGATAQWNWPRGVLLYAERSILVNVGGMDEAFGPGGHEHVEWSRRIFQAGHTPAPYCSPAEYAQHERGPAMGAGRFWHAEDMPHKGEPLGNFRVRKRRHTSIKAEIRDWSKITEVMESRDGDTTFVPFRAGGNRRLSATLCSNLEGRGAGGDT